MMKYSTARQGVRLRICLSEQVRRFLDDLPTPRRAAMDRTLGELANRGQVRNKQRFIKERGNIFAVKAGNVRVYGWFFAGRLFVCGHGVIKKSRKADPKALDRAERLFEMFQRGDYEFEDDPS